MNKPVFETEPDLNVLGEPLHPCSADPVTGFYRNGCCSTGPEDQGRHVVCAVMTEAFLAFSKSVGNDLTTPRPEFSFPGLKAGDRWCLVALRWAEAMRAGMAPRVVLAATHQAALRDVKLEDLKRYAVDLS
ncbi:DUF2237 family protein [Devosia sp.]|uniref:DUF2237 family protein n=1 Tax=Devosia sp. TaxID=1871048 RepID=UPI002F10C124